MPAGPIHLILVSREVASNLTPALAQGAVDPAFPPARVILLAEPRWRNQAGYLKAALTAHRIKVKTVSLRASLDLASIEVLEAQIEKLLAGLSQADRAQIVLNASGGSRPLALAATSVFIRRGLPVFAVDPRSDHVAWLADGGRENFDIPDQARLEDVLRANGFSVAAPPPRRQPLRKELRRVCATLAANAASFDSAMGLFNRYIHNVRRTPDGFRTEMIQEKHIKNRSFKKLLNLFLETDLLQRKDGRLVFEDGDAVRFLHGGWLEFHVYGVLEQLRRDWAGKARRPRIQDAAAALNIQGPSGVPNEIDVAFLANNRLYLMECKSGYFPKGGKGSSKASTMLYKIDWMKDLGRPGCRAAVVAYRDLPRHDLERAAQMDIAVVSGAAAIGDLRRFLEIWIGSN